MITNEVTRYCNCWNIPCHRFDPQTAPLRCSTLRSLLILLSHFTALRSSFARPKYTRRSGNRYRGRIPVNGNLRFRLSPANLISELAGAYVCFIFYELLKPRQNMAPWLRHLLPHSRAVLHSPGSQQFLCVRQYSRCTTVISVNLLWYTFPLSLLLR